MGSYKGPSCKICRRNRVKLFLKGARCFTAKCEIEKRNFPPGAAPGARAGKMSEYGVRLREKQKLRYFYGISENTMRRSYQRASQKKGITGYNLLLIFESRLDNVLYRTHVCRSRKEARQIVRHGHVKVNGRKVDIPSFEVRVGDLIELSEKKRDFFVGNLQAVKEAQGPTAVQFDEKALTIKFLHAPKREEIDVPVQEQLIVEYYSR